jgi:hypothetical protein
MIANVPWWLLTALVLAGAAVTYWANRANSPPWRSGGIVLICLTLLLASARFLIDTDAEKAERMTRQIVSCADRGDWQGVEVLLGPGTDTDFLGQRPNVTGAAAIRQAAEAAAHAAGLHSVKIWALRTEQNNDWITVTFVAYTTQDETQDRPLPSSWEFDWHRTGQKPNLTKITLLSIGNQP